MLSVPSRLCAVLPVPTTFCNSGQKNLILLPSNYASLGSKCNTPKHLDLGYSILITLGFTVGCLCLHTFETGIIFTCLSGKNHFVLPLHVCCNRWGQAGKNTYYFNFMISKFFLYKVLFSAFTQLLLFLVSISLSTYVLAAFFPTLTVMPYFIAASITLSTLATAPQTPIQCLKMGMLPRTSLGTGTGSDTLCKDGFLISVG